VTKRGVNLVHMAFLDQSERFELEPSAEARAFAELAVAKGVDPNQKVGDGSTLKEIAEKNGAIDFAQYLAGLKP
jgi:ankyrin repeat protein